MKKKREKKLVLSKETLADLHKPALRGVLGGLVDSSGGGGGMDPLTVKNQGCA